MPENEPVRSGESDGLPVADPRSLVLESEVGRGTTVCVTLPQRRL
jgi:hypothetical protein